MIRVLITDDSGLIGTTLKTLLQTEDLIEVVGWAKNGRECIELCKQLKPDVITMDIVMPVMDGLEATRYIMQNMPCSILVVSAMVKNNPSLVFELLKVGANGLFLIKKSGGLTICQDEKSCAIFGMPKAAIELGAAMEICTIEKMAEKMNRL